MDQDRQRIERIRTGDESALRELYDALGGHVFALALRITGSREDAEEVLQDTFVQVHRASDRFDPALGSVRAWVYTIARNGCRMRLRARNSRPRRPVARPGVEGVDGLAGDGTAGQTVDAGMHLADAQPAGHARGPAEVTTERIELERVFSTLSSGEVGLLEDAFLAGYSHAEIAERDGVPLGTVKSRIRRALLKAREALTGAAQRADAAGSSEEPS